MNQTPFTPEDFDLLLKVLAFGPDLDLLAHATKLARSKLTYPVNGWEVWDGSFSFGERRISAEEAQQYFPPEFFPITSEDDFMTKIYIALMNGRMAHSAENLERASSSQPRQDSRE